jgi:hypothetical protein
VCDSGIHPGAAQIDSWLGLTACGPPNNGKTVHESKPLSSNLEWQCVELVERWLYEEYGLPPQAPPGSAGIDANGWQIVNDYWAYIHGHPGSAPLAKVTPTTSFPSDLAPGDVISYGSASPGHTNVVIDASGMKANGDGSIITLNQNYGSGGRLTQKVHDWVPEPLHALDGTPMKATSWLHATGLPFRRTNAWLSAISCADTTTCFSTGFTCSTIGNCNDISASSADVAYIGHWGTNGWTRVPAKYLPSSAEKELGGVSCPTPTDCVAVGQSWQHGTVAPLTERLTRTGWKPGESANLHDWYTSLQSVSCPTVSQCMGVGYYLDPTQSSQPAYSPLMESWNGKSWTILGGPKIFGGEDGSGGVGFNGVSCFKTMCMAAGVTETLSNGYNSTLTGLWNGRTRAWFSVPTPSPSNDAGFFSISCPGSHLCFAVGRYNVSGNYRALIERWNGHVWHIVPGIGSLPGADEFTSISCSSAHECMAVGPDTFTEQWTDGVWTPVPRPSNVQRPEPYEITYGISCFDSHCLSVGANYGQNGSHYYGATELWNTYGWFLVAN